MAAAVPYLPFPTELDPTESPPTSVDPLGTLGAAERLGDVILPGFTNRMWRARLLTLSALAAEISDRVVRQSGREADRSQARLAFERLYVAAIARAAELQREAFLGATRNVPGITLATAAFRSNVPLVPANFLRAQSVNGPTGVMARLARAMDLVKEDWSPSSHAGLLLAWARDRELPGLLDERGGSKGSDFLARVTKHTRRALEGEWPGPGQQVWIELTKHLRPDRVGCQERAVIRRLLDESDRSGVRRRVLCGLVRVSRTWARAPDGRDPERQTLRAFRQTLGSTPVDVQIATALNAIDAYEKGSAALEQTFDLIRWGLRETGQASPSRLASSRSVSAALSTTRHQLRAAARDLKRAAATIDTTPALAGQQHGASLRELAAVCECGVDSNEALVTAVLDRHEKVQGAKRKRTWIDRAEKLVLMPGFGFDGDGPPNYIGTFRHPYRVANAFAFLSALNRIGGSSSYGEA